MYLKVRYFAGTDFRKMKIEDASFKKYFNFWKEAIPHPTKFT